MAAPLMSNASTAAAGTSPEGPPVFGSSSLFCGIVLRITSSLGEDVLSPLVCDPVVLAPLVAPVVSPVVVPPDASVVPVVVPVVPVVPVVLVPVVVPLLVPVVVLVVLVVLVPVVVPVVPVVPVVVPVVVLVPVVVPVVVVVPFPRDGRSSQAMPSLSASRLLGSEGSRLYSA